MVAPGRSVPRFFGFGNQAQRSPVLDAATGIQILEFGVDARDVRGDELAQVEDGGLADQFGNVLGDPEGGHFSNFHEQP